MHIIKIVERGMSLRVAHKCIGRFNINWLIKLLYCDVACHVGWKLNGVEKFWGAMGMRYGGKFVHVSSVFSTRIKHTPKVLFSMKNCDKKL